MRGRLSSLIDAALSRLSRRGGAVANAMRTAVVGLTMRVHVRMANLWRTQYNPLRGLTMQRAVGYLEAGERGDYADLQWLYRYIEKRDATLRGGKRSLISAVAEMDWEIKQVEEDRLPPGCTVAMAEAQAVTLRTAYDAIANLTAAIEFLCLAEFRGFSHLEKVIDEEGVLFRLEPVEQWYWNRDGINGEWCYNKEARTGRTRGDPVDLSRFVIREIDDPINEIALIAYVRKQLGRKDEDGFIESFGIPSIFAIMPQNVPAGDEDKYLDIAEKVIGDSRGALPFGSDIKSVDAGVRGVAPFRAYQEALDQEIVLAITSGQLTMLAESGSGTLAGGAHSETFLRVARALARRITAVLQEQLDLELLEAAHPGEPPLAYFEILCAEETDVSDVVQDISSLSAAGLEVDESWVEEKTGYPVTRKAPPPPGMPGLLPNRAPVDAPEDADAEFMTAALEALEEAGAADHAPLAARLQSLLEEDLSEEEFRSRLAQLRADLPGLAREVAGGEALAAAWEDILGAAMGEGLAEKDEGGRTKDED